MAKKKEKKEGSEAFDEYYRALFGNRWDSLKEALSKPSRQVAFENGLLKPYYLDVGSVRVAKALPLQGASCIADMCAAPGGKSLVIASSMEENASLVSNERSRDRKARLIRVLDEHLPENIRSRINVTGFDAARWCSYETEVYDRILLDVPCSSERHVFTDEKYLAQWSPARIKNLSMTQWSILSSAFRVLKQGGFMVYSTCALSPSENDSVIEKLLKKYSDAHVVEVSEENEICNGEKTKYGIHILPDVQSCAGPLFYTLIKKDICNKME